MNPPSVYELTSPSSQSTSKITNTVHSITFLSVGSHVPSCDAVPLRLWKAKFLHGSPVCIVPYEWPRLQLFHYGTQVPFRGFKLSTRGIVIASCQIDHDPHRAIAQLGTRGMQINHQIAAHLAQRDHRAGADDVERSLRRRSSFQSGRSSQDLRADGEGDHKIDCCGRRLRSTAVNDRGHSRVARQQNRSCD